MSVAKGKALVAFTVYHGTGKHAVSAEIDLVQGEDMINHTLNSMLQAVKNKMDDCRRKDAAK